MRHAVGQVVYAMVAVCAMGAGASGQAALPQQATANGGALPASVPLPPGYVIGVEDLLAIVFWRDQDISGEVVVRPDGMVSLPLLRDVKAAGYTPQQLSDLLEKAASKFVSEPNATVIVREIRSRKVFVLGEVGKPGAVPLTGEMNVLQLIATVGGLLEHASRDDITVIRRENGKERRFKFNYNDVVRGKKPEQNILLQPGDTVVVK